MKDRLFSYRWPVAIFSIYILFIFVYFVIVFQASINLRNILEVREKEQLVSLETTLRLYWKVRWKQSPPTHPSNRDVKKNEIQLKTSLRLDY